MAQVLEERVSRLEGVLEQMNKRLERIERREPAWKLKASRDSWTKAKAM